MIAEVLLISGEVGRYHHKMLLETISLMTEFMEHIATWVSTQTKP